MKTRLSSKLHFPSPSIKLLTPEINNPDAACRGMLFSK